MFFKLLKGRLHLFDEIIVNHMNINQIVNLIKAKNYNIRYGVADSSSKKKDLTTGISAFKQLQSLLGVKILTRKIPDKEKMLYIAQSALYDSTLYIDPTCQQTLKMFMNYAWTDSGKMPHNKYSHIHDCLVYAVLNYKLKHRQNTNIHIKNRNVFSMFT